MIWNSGSLPENWNVDQLLKKHSSQPHNPDIANAFFRAGEIDAWGRGIARIFEACLSAENPLPELCLETGGLWVKTPDRIIALLRENSAMTLAEVANAMGMSTSAIERASAKLVKKEKLKYVGPKKGGHWKLLE